MKRSLAVFLLFACHMAFAQPDPLADFNKHAVANWNGKYFQIGPYRVKGSPYLFGQSFSGTIRYTNGKIVTGNVLYDIYNQNAGFDANGEIAENKQDLDAFTIQLTDAFGGKLLEFKKTSGFGTKSLKGYIAVLAEGAKFSLLQYYKATLMADPVNQMDKGARVFEQASEYYLYNKSTGEIKKVKLREKDILKEINNPIVVELVKTKKIDLSKEYDVVKLVKNIQ